uniref:Transmembrane protein 243 n=1 Tax=Podarcis muralis TaxID=64176 RepID=A0A670HY81_PODMU
MYILHKNRLLVCDTWREEDYPAEGGAGTCRRRRRSFPKGASSPGRLAQDRIINLAVGSVTSLLLIVTLISAFVFPQLPPKPIYWYRQGDLEPKFRNLIYYILFSIIMLCICANLYFHEVGK